MRLWHLIVIFHFIILSFLHKWLHYYSLMSLMKTLFRWLNFTSFTPLPSFQQITLIFLFFLSFFFWSGLRLMCLSVKDTLHARWSGQSVLLYTLADQTRARRLWAWTLFRFEKFYRSFIWCVVMWCRDDGESLII